MNQYHHQTIFHVVADVHHCIKYARIRIFTDPHSPLCSRILDLVLREITIEYGSVKNRILAYFMQRITW